MSQKLLSGLAVLLVIFFSLQPASARASKKQEIKALNKAIEQQLQVLQELKNRVKALEEEEAEEDAKVAEPEKAAPAPSVPGQKASEQSDETMKTAVPTEKTLEKSPVGDFTGEAPSPAEEAELKAAKWRTRQSPVPYQGNFDDKQDAAARPGDYTLDPQYRGFIQIPRTAFMIKFNPKPRVDMTIDNRNSGDNFRFVTAKIPLEGTPEYGGGEQFNINGNGSQLRVDMRAPSVAGNFRFYYQNDFFGSDTANFRYRLQHMYGQYYGITAGFTYGVFEDPDIWPDTLDYEGPNSTIFARRPLIQYKRAFTDSLNMTFGIEAPDIYVDTSGDPTASTHRRMPDLGFNLRWEPAGKGHMQFSTIFRSVGANGGTTFPDDNDFAWGLNLSGSFNVTPKDTLQFLGVFGYGVGGMGNDTSFINSDAAFNAAGDLVPLQYVSGMFGYTHRWTPRMRSTLSYGFAHLENTDLQPGDAYHFTHYGSWNLVYQLIKRLHIGAEGLYGFKQVKDGRNGDVFRAQISMIYSLFD